MASDESLVQAARILARAMAERVPFQSAEFPSGLQSDAIYQRLLRAYTDELVNASASDQGLWVLKRLASIESRVMTLETNALQHGPAPIDGELEPEDVFAITRSQKTFPSEIELILDDKIVQSGFYPSERFKSGPLFRWIGPEPRARIFLPRVEGSVRIDLTILYAFVEGIISQVKVSLDEGPWATGTAQQDGEKTILTFTPERGSKRYLQTMQLDIDAVRSDTPKQLGMADRRSLSLAVASVAVHPLERKSKSRK